jgi:hypothetical protein
MMASEGSAEYALQLILKEGLFARKPLAGAYVCVCACDMCVFARKPLACLCVFDIYVCIDYHTPLHICAFTPTLHHTLHTHRATFVD